MKDLSLVFIKKDGNHLLPISESLLPILVIQVSLDVFFFAALVLFHDKFFEWVLKNTTEDPLLKDLEVRQ